MKTKKLSNRNAQKALDILIKTYVQMQTDEDANQWFIITGTHLGFYLSDQELFDKIKFNIYNGNSDAAVTACQELINRGTIPDDFLDYIQK